jgi:hypothetical protein
MGSRSVRVPPSQGFIGNGTKQNPFHNLFLCIFKHNGIFTDPVAAFSHEVVMGSGFSEVQNPE